jgi:PQQ-dependent catabolism-associated CXXCW motif protein
MRACARLLALFLASSAAAQVAEPQGLWSGAMRGETTTTLAGATLVDAEAVAGLREKGALLLDVAEAPKKPDKLSAATPWLPTHVSIPGAIWLPGAGSGSPDPDFQTRFALRIAALTGGDKQKPIVVFCHPRCWGSWNAGKRLVMLGYTQVHWAPGGVEEWRETHEAAPVEDDAAWKASGP